MYLAMTLHPGGTNEPVSDVCLGFIGGRIAGKTMLVFNDTR